jgi:hypothetical protein
LILYCKTVTTQLVVYNESSSGETAASQSQVECVESTQQQRTHAAQLCSSQQSQIISLAGVSFLLILVAPCWKKNPATYTNTKIILFVPEK